LRLARLHRFFATLLVLTYLLVGSGLARAVIWCIDESGHSHVEFNPAGDCQVACKGTGDRQTAPELPGLTSNAPEQSCQDVGLLTSQAQDSRLSKLMPPQSTALVIPLPSVRALAGTLLHTAPPYFAQLPPTTALAALRTVVLLT
jgi:hypothetical protein